MKSKESKAEEYLDIHFPKEVYYRGVKKPESKLRGEAMVLLAEAKIEGINLERKRIKKIINKWLKEKTYANPDGTSILRALDFEVAELLLEINKVKLI